jgi:GT2 family glycosyltransferase
MMNYSEEKLWVVIPTYNRIADLMDCLDSLLCTDINKEQIIVVDNNSQDTTLEKIQGYYPEVVLIALKDNLGATGASNVGFKHAIKMGASYVLRLDSDTVVAPNFIRPLLEMISKDRQIGVVAPKIYYSVPSDEIWYAGADTHPWHFGTKNGHRHEKDNPENSRVRDVDYVWGAAMLIRADILRKTNGFDTDFFVYYEEVDFCQRVQKLGFRLVFVPNSHVWHKVGSMANNAWTAYQWNRSKMLLYRKHAKNLLHFTYLLIYAFLYAFEAHINKKNHGGNRGPIKSALKGLWCGLTEKQMNFNQPPVVKL